MPNSIDSILTLVGAQLSAVITHFGIRALLTVGSCAQQHDGLPQVAKRVPRSTVHPQSAQRISMPESLRTGCSIRVSLVMSAS